MTARIYLSAALRGVLMSPVVGERSLMTYPEAADAILANLPEGVWLTDPQDEQVWYEAGVRQERERLRKLIKKEVRREPWPEFGPLSDGRVAARAAFNMAIEIVLDHLMEGSVLGERDAKE